MAFALVACNDKDTHKGEFSVDVNNAADFKKLADNLGRDYDKGVYNIKSDIILEGDWTPIGNSIDNSFRGTINGNGHTIAYSINIPEPETRSEELNEIAYYGLFGVIFGAKINDLNVHVNLSVPADAESQFIGGLAGYAYGDNDIKNINVYGNVTATMGNICRVKTNTDGSRSVEPERYDMAVSIGGLVGYSIGNAKYNGINSAVNITVNSDESVKTYKDSDDEEKRAITLSAVSNLTMGGVVGTLRTINLSSEKSNAEYIEAQNLTYNGNLNASGELVNAGGIVGSAYRVKNASKWVSTAGVINTKSYKRLNVGGVAGSLDRVALAKSKSMIGEINAKRLSTTQTTSYNVGGFAGYCANFTSLNNVVSSVDKIVLPVNVFNYTGGLVGMLHFSSINNAVADGELYYDRALILNDTHITYSHNAKENPYYVNNGGIVGRVYGESVLGNLATKFTAFQGIAGELANAVEIITIKEDEGETFDAWLQDSSYSTARMTYEKSGEKKDGEQKYRVVHLYDVKSTDAEPTIFYVNTNAKVYNDSLINQDAVSYNNNVGKAKDDIATEFNALSQAIEAVINA